MDTLGKRLRYCRHSKGITQAVIGKAVGMSQANLSDLENDLYPSSSFIPHLASYYGISSLWLATGEGEREISTLDPTSEEALPEDLKQTSLEILRSLAKNSKK